MRLFYSALVLLVAPPVILACTETPSDFPPCVSPYAPCPGISDAGADGHVSDGATVDATGDAPPQQPDVRTDE
ncbi:MAG: hypothetical protein ACREJ3_00245 [Polyangiaceae bacterium]